MPPLVRAPGWPGGAPTWTSSAKDVVTTALGPSRTWVTLGYGIVNEIYWPWTGQPQIRDLGFIVAGGGRWFEVKRVRRYLVDVPKPYIPLPRITHEGEAYRLELEVIPDPARDTVLIQFNLTGENLKLYALLAPHLDGSGTHNNARAGECLTAWKDNAALCLASDSCFSRSSAGYVGSSDGWQDFSRNGAMTWTYALAEDGNVALMGELAQSRGVLALGFADSLEGAHTLAHSSLSERFDVIRERFVAGWEEWAQTVKIPDAPPAVREEAYLSATVVQVHQDRTYPGAIVASLSVPWGNTSDSSGGYHLVWPRDAVEASLALLAVGKIDAAQRTLAYLIAIQRADGSWSQSCFPDGRAYWSGVQLDEVAFPMLLAAKLREMGALGRLEGVATMVRRATGYLVASGPISPQDRWEETAGISPFTLGLVIASLVGGSDFLDDDEAGYVLSLTDYWNDRLEDWTYSEGGPLTPSFGIDGYYVRIGPSPAQCGLRGRIELRNRNGGSIEATRLIGMEYLYLVRLGLRRADDRRIQNTLEVSEALLRVDTPAGVAYHRYNEDGYGEHEDGSPFDGSGIGRAWPLLTGERGHYDLLAGRDPLPYLEMMARMTGPGGLIPEQVWDAPPIPDQGLALGNPTGAAMPLVWAHAEFLKLLVARGQGKPIELLHAVQDRYREGPRAGTAWHWRHELPFEGLPADRDLVIESPTPFKLRIGFDGWTNASDATSAPLPFGRHGVRLRSADLTDRDTLDFTFYFIQDNRWEGVDHQVLLGQRCP